MYVTGHDAEEAGHAAWESNPRDARRNRKPSSRLADGHETDGGRGLHSEANSEARHRAAFPAKRSRSDPSTDPLGPAGEPHVPRRKRSKPTELIRPLEVLAASNAAASGILLRMLA